MADSQRTGRQGKSSAWIKQEDRILHPDKPIHRRAESLLTDSLDFQGFSGFNIWLTIFLSSAVVSLLIENIRTGIRLRPELWSYYLTGSKNGGLESLLVYMILYSCVPATLCLFLERSIAEKKIPEKIGILAHVLNISQLLILPTVITYSTTFSTVGSAYTCVIYLAQFLKLWSYVHVNYWCRLASDTANVHRLTQNNSDSSQKKDSLVHYPDNLAFKDMAYFFIAPTLCYELNFPRTNHIRKRFVLKCLLELILLIILAICLCEQWLTQAVRNSLYTYINENDMLKSIELMLRLNIPAYLLWLIWFYSFFQSYLNLIAELTYFADRTFYFDWWNATSVEMFWRKWNTVVHRWALRHTYLPVLELGYSRNVGISVVFFVSALLHEFLFSVPLKIIEFQTFFGMLFQLPIITISSWIEKQFGPRCGAIMVTFFIVFSPYKLILTYCHNYLITHSTEAELGSYFSN